MFEMTHAVNGPLMVLAQAEAGNQPSMLMQMFPFLVMIVLFYFLLIRPQVNRQKDHEKLVSNVKTGDQVVAAGGIYGTVTNVKDKSVILRVAEGVKIEVERTSVTTVTKSNDKPSSKEEVHGNN